MAAKTSLAAELFRAITAPKITPIPAYLPESDGASIHWFLQSELAKNYAIDTSNLHWGGEINKEHIFDIYKNYTPDKDSVKTRLSMLEYVANNVTRYNRSCYCYLKMNNLTLDQWVKKLTHFDNGGDALCLYALSDMLGVHTTVLTKGKAWTTVQGNYPGTLDDVLQLSEVKLFYLGQDKYAVLWKKVSPSESSIHQRNYNYNPMLPLAQPPSQVELETAETLVQMQQIDQTVDTSIVLPHPPEFMSPNVSTDADAMDKITDRYDVNLNGRPLLRDAMDQVIGLDDLWITDVRSLHVETESEAIESNNDIELCVETDQQALTTPNALEYVHSSKPVILKECSVRLQSLESILFSETDRKKKPSGNSNANPALEPPPPFVPKNTTPPSVKPSTSASSGKRQKGEKTSKKLHRYGCRMCKVRVETSQALKDHHQTAHGIMYCKLCKKAFNNQLSLTRHEYEHKSRPYTCETCGDSFPFESQLTTHTLTHSNRRKHACTYTTCDKRFKNLGDRNRHVKEHTSPWLRCPDCPEYKTKAKRDFESHRLKHSKIERYFCENCGVGFVYNTQKIRHVKNKLCKKA